MGDDVVHLRHRWDLSTHLGSGQRHQLRRLRCAGDRQHPAQREPTLSISAGQVLPTGFSGLGNYGTSGAVADLSPSGGGAAFAWMDVAPPPSSTNVSPLFDTVNGYSASRLYSATFTASAGATLTLDADFLTNDGSPYPDYGVVALQTVTPEPSSLCLAGLGALRMIGYALRRRQSRGGRS